MVKIFNQDREKEDRKIYLPDNERVLIGFITLIVIIFGGAFIIFI
jgi:hypothetical protein